MHNHASEGISQHQQQTLPDKLFYKIGEVSKITGVETYVLRYWETEFPFLRPRKNRSGQRVYVKKDLEMIMQIRKMLYLERYTIEGVRKRFGESPVRVSDIKTQPECMSASPQNQADILKLVKKRLKDILNQIK
jgi:DNA-binding transcriptional MerR regulator